MLNYRLLLVDQNIMVCLLPFFYTGMANSVGPQPSGIYLCVRVTIRGHDPIVRRNVNERRVT